MRARISVSVLSAVAVAVEDARRGRGVEEAGVEEAVVVDAGVGAVVGVRDGLELRGVRGSDGRDVLDEKLSDRGILCVCTNACI